MKDEILVEQLSKTFQVPEREPGFAAAMRSFFHRKYPNVLAVQQASFSIQPGEILGLLGVGGGQFPGGLADMESRRAQIQRRQRIVAYNHFIGGTSLPCCKFCLWIANTSLTPTA